MQELTHPVIERGALHLLRGFLLWSTITAFIVGGFYSGWLAMPRLLGWAVAVAPAGFVQNVAPFQVDPSSAATKTAPDWQSLERVNILLMGVDQRSDELDLPTRTDTMILVTLDPYTQSAGMLSLPRDLWVPIPLQPGSPVQDRINTAHVYGDLYEYPGGGAALAKETVQYNLGVRIHYYVMLDFKGFQRIIDTLGGVEIDVPAPLVDNFFPTPDYSTMRISFQAGRQNMDGERALWYVRTRHMDSDFGRMHRQQQFMLALRQRLLQFDVLPKVPQLWSELKDSIKTDMSLAELVSLGAIAREVKDDNILTGALDGGYITEITTRDGGSVLLPNRNKTRELVGKIFFDARAQSTSAKVEVLNGTRMPGLAARVKQRLEIEGINEVSTGNAEGGPYTTTQIQNFNGKAEVAERIATFLNLPRGRVVSMPRPEDTTADIRVILGDDTP